MSLVILNESEEAAFCRLVGVIHTARHNIFGAGFGSEVVTPAPPFTWRNNHNRCNRQEGGGLNASITSKFWRLELKREAG